MTFCGVCPVNPCGFFRSDDCDDSETATECFRLARGSYHLGHGCHELSMSMTACLKKVCSEFFKRHIPL